MQLCTALQGQRRRVMQALRPGRRLRMPFVAQRPAELRSATRPPRQTGQQPWWLKRLPGSGGGHRKHMLRWPLYWCVLIAAEHQA